MTFTQIGTRPSICVSGLICKASKEFDVMSGAASTTYKRASQLPVEGGASASQREGPAQRAGGHIYAINMFRPTHHFLENGTVLVLPQPKMPAIIPAMQSLRQDPKTQKRKQKTIDRQRPSPKTNRVNCKSSSKAKRPP
jgi:hypothetical protein